MTYLSVLLIRDTVFNCENLMSVNVDAVVRNMHISTYKTHISYSYSYYSFGVF